MNVRISRNRAIFGFIFFNLFLLYLLFPYRGSFLIVEENYTLFFPVKLNPITNWFFFLNQRYFFISSDCICIEFLLTNITTIIQARYINRPFTVIQGFKRT